VGSCTSLGQQQKKGASVLRWLASAKLRGLGVGAIVLIRAMCAGKTIMEMIQASGVLTGRARTGILRAPDGARGDAPAVGAAGEAAAAVGAAGEAAERARAACSESVRGYELPRGVGAGEAEDGADALAQ